MPLVISTPFWQFCKNNLDVDDDMTDVGADTIDVDDVDDDAHVIGQFIDNVWENEFGWIQFHFNAYLRCGASNDCDFYTYMYNYHNDTIQYWWSIYR